MGSRIKENPEKIFEWFFEAACPKTLDKDPLILSEFPDDFSDPESSQILPRFCFPFNVERVQDNGVVQHFTFVLTDLEGNQRFGFCRLTMGCKSCICILSYLPWFEVFYKLLNNLADLLAAAQKKEMEELLISLYNHPVPKADCPISLEFGHRMKITTRKLLKGQRRAIVKDHGSGMQSLSYFIAPDVGSLPTIPENRNLTEYVVVVDVNNMLNLYASMLYERRILITSSKLSTLTACIHASSSMLYPMYWQHIYIPVLPPHLLDYCCAPMPYLIGVHSSLMEKVKSKALEDIVMLNIDSNTLESPFDDLEKLPTEVVSLLKMKLKKQSAATGDGVARAFLKAQATLFGGYRNALVCNPGEPITFSKELFLNHKSSSMKQFLQNAMHLQLFKQFIDNRLEKLNAGVGLIDVFEEEITQSGIATGNLKAYSLWVENLKKGSDALIHTVKSKTNPAMKNIYKYAKGHAKLGLKEMKLRLKNKESSDHKRIQRGGSLRYEQYASSSLARRSNSDCLQSRLPITQHFGQSRPRRPTKRYTKAEDLSSTEADMSSQGTLECVQECSNPDGDSSTAVEELEEDFLNTGEIDLLGEIFDTLSTNTVREKGLLYGTRSLDFYKMEDTDYIRSVKSINPSDENLSCPSMTSYRTDRWFLEEEEEDGDSLRYEISSSEEISSTGRSEVSIDQDDSEICRDTKALSHGASEPIYKPPRGSGMWDRGVAECAGDSYLSSDALSANQLGEKLQPTGVPWEVRKTLQKGSHDGENGSSATLYEKQDLENIVISGAEMDGQKLHHESQVTHAESLQGISEDCLSMKTCDVHFSTNSQPDTNELIQGRSSASDENPLGLEADSYSIGERFSEVRPLQQFTASTKMARDISAEKSHVPSVQSAVALFQAKTEKTGVVYRGRDHLSPFSLRHSSQLNRPASIYKAPEAKAENILHLRTLEGSLDSAVNGSIPGPEHISQETSQGSRLQPQSSASELHTNPLLVKKVSELKKRFEA
ncbi:DENN domain-containing protein 1B-like isoform X2 [Protopterus annectens]|uniref:DENN domain-containing protein 1B-like isoform X2 n=1 Tax=Protopterus annectens TaxID=7888 RepID=UPI001CF9972A|nr:DENN domain-containing protein 1B-like isoform X2 [Protopterus annectens]